MSLYLLTSLRAALRAGDAILAVYRNEFSVGYKGDRSPLTAADRRSHRVIAAAVSSRKLPRLPLLSEEGKTTPYAERKQWKRFWLVDPLDGTKEFVKRNGEFTVNIALIEGNRPVAGVIYAPVTGAAYFAERGSGAYTIQAAELSALFRRAASGGEASGAHARQRDGQEQALMESVVSAARRLAPLEPGAPANGSITVAGSRSHGSKEFCDFVERLRTRYENVELVPAGSSLKFCLVAEGKAHLYPRLGPTMEWDTAAGDVILSEAGGRVVESGAHGELTYNKENLVNPSFLALSDSLIMNDL